MAYLLHWYFSQQIKNNFNDFSNQVKEELKNFSQLANKVEEELQNIQKEVKSLVKTIEGLVAIESELKNVTASLTELNKTGENIKGSLDNVGELKEKIDELTKLEIPLIELEKSLIKGGQGLEKEIREKIGGLVDQIKEYKKVFCPACFN
ncbi:3572_t:CDS:2 [Entrophospora sp. SA101]|nr:3572_t:CDS:2 [Entrophospora sp. SA101]